MLRSRRNINGIKQSRPLAFIMMISNDAITFPERLALGIDLAASRSNDPSGSFAGRQNSTDCLDFSHIEAIGHQNSNSPRRNGRLLRHIMDLGQRRFLFSMIRTSWFVRNDSIYVFGDRTSKVKIDVVEDIDITFVNSVIVTVTEFEGNGGSQMIFFIFGQRVEEELCLVEMFLEFGSSNTLLNTCHLFFEPEPNVYT